MMNLLFLKMLSIEYAVDMAVVIDMYSKVTHEHGMYTVTKSIAKADDGTVITISGKSIHSRMDAVIRALCSLYYVGLGDELTLPKEMLSHGATGLSKQRMHDVAIRREAWREGYLASDSDHIGPHHKQPVNPYDKVTPDKCDDEVFMVNFEKRRDEERTQYAAKWGV